MFDFSTLKMESSDSELSLGDERNTPKILNAENGLTFCIQVGDMAIPHNFSLSPPPALTSSEPTISVIEEDLEEEQEFISHEIVADKVENPKFNVNSSGARKNLFNSKIKRSTKFSSNKFQKSLSRTLWKPVISKAEEGLSETFSDGDSEMEEGGPSLLFNIKKKRRYNKRVLPTSNPPKISKMRRKPDKEKKSDVMSIVLKNMVQNQRINYSGMKMMINPENGEYVIKSNAVKESFTIEPWMLDKPQIMQASKEKLFVLNNSINSTCPTSPNLPTPTVVVPNPSNTEEESIVICPSKEILHTPTKYFIKEERGEVGEKVVSITNNDNSEVVYWEEGNINKVTDFISISDRTKELYAKLSNFNPNCSHLELPDYLSGIETFESPVPTRSGAAPGVVTFLSWDAVKERIEELQEETMTKFIFEYKTPTFRAEPEPFKKIHFELDTIRKEVPVIIPNNGIPFIFLGICVYTCHLGKRRWKPKDLSEDDESKPLRTKKIGCPALLSVSRIARFPDFDASSLSPKCEVEVLKQLKDAWDFDTSRVRYYVEYHVREPKAEDHKGHEVQFMVSNNRFKEPVDPRILDKIRDLTRQGYTATRTIHQKVLEFIRTDLFKGGDPPPPPDRRRYNPSRRDIRYAIFKAKEELKKEGKSVTQLQCSTLALQIADLAKDIKHEAYLNSLKSYLTGLWRTVKAQEPLESMIMLSGEPSSGLPPSSTPTKRTYRKRKSDSSPSIATPPDNSKDFLPDQLPDQVIEQFYINVPEANENIFTGQLYAPDLMDMTPGLVDPLQPPAGEEEGGVTTEVYYYYPDGTCELATPVALAGVQS